MYDITNNFTVPKLKAVCHTLGLSVGGTKVPLQARLRSYFNGLLDKKDAVRFGVGSGVVERERGSEYGHPRVRYVLLGVDLILVDRMGIKPLPQQPHPAAIMHGDYHPCTIISDFVCFLFASYSSNIQKTPLL